jgi:hypothetical protein
MNFDEWCDEYDKIAAAEGAGESYTKACGRDAFKQAFDDGETPAEAWLEEKLAGV